MNFEWNRSLPVFLSLSFFLSVGKIDAQSQLESVLDLSRTIQDLKLSSGDWLSVVAKSREGNTRVKAATGEKLKRLKNNVEVCCS